MLKHYKVPVLLIEFNPEKVRGCLKSLYDFIDILL